MSSSNKIKILVAIIAAASAIIVALITGIFTLLAKQMDTNAIITSVAATYVAQRTADVPAAQATYTLPPTFTPLPTQQPYTLIPAPKPNVTVVTPKPIVVVATPSADQQNPPPGSQILAGQSYTKNYITLTSSKTVDIQTDGLRFSITIENQSNRQLAVIWKNSFAHLQDDKGKEYRQRCESYSECNLNKQFPIPSGERYTMSTYDFYSTGSFDFVGRLDPTVKYLVLTIDQLAGMTTMKWRYDIQ